MTDLRYPIGPFEFDASRVTDETRQAALAAIEETPMRLRAAVAGLADEQLDTPYRPGGWTVRQVVHHVPDSHLNSYVRFKLALTEPTPTIVPYDENAWAMLVDSSGTPVEVSLQLLERLHERWMVLLRSLGSEELAREFRHPEIGVVSLDKNLELYSWHGRHHVAHVTSLRERMGWT
jgi:hypothetical protein